MERGKRISFGGFPSEHIWAAFLENGSVKGCPSLGSMTESCCVVQAELGLTLLPENVNNGRLGVCGVYVRAFTMTNNDLEACTLVISNSFL